MPLVLLNRKHDSRDLDAKLQSEYQQPLQAGLKHTFRTLGSSEDIVPAKTRVDPRSQRSSALTSRGSASSSTTVVTAVWPRSTMRTGNVAADSERKCLTRIGLTSLANSMRSEDIGRVAILMERGAVSDSWKAAGSPTSTSGLQKTTCERTWTASSQ
jgi:hypothetical protein